MSMAADGAIAFGTSGNRLPVPEFVPFPTDALPKAAADLVRAGALSLQVSEAMLGPLALASMAAGIGRARTIALHASWHEPSVLWVAVVAPSGSGKSPALELVTRPAERRREAERTYLRLAEGDDDREARQLLDIVRRKGGSVSGRELVQSSRKFKTVKDAEAALSRLVDAGHGQWVYLPQRGPGAPKARRFVLPGASGDSVYRTPAGVVANGDSVCVDAVDTSASTPAGGAA